MAKTAEKLTTWGDVVAAKVGHIFIDRFDDGIRFLIMRGPASVCAYVGVPEDHPLAGHSYERLPIHAHGGLTYASVGGEGFPKGYFWYGWDYAHSGDRCTYYEPEEIESDYRKAEQQWTPEDVDKDSWSALYEFKDLMKLSEAIARKAKETL